MNEDISARAFLYVCICALCTRAWLCTWACMYTYISTSGSVYAQITVCVYACVHLWKCARLYVRLACACVHLLALSSQCTFVCGVNVSVNAYKHVEWAPLWMHGATGMRMKWPCVPGHLLCVCILGA